MRATKDNWKDVQKYFLETYVICPEYAIKEALWVDRVDPGGMRVRCTNGDKGFVEFPYEIKSPLNTRREYWQYGDSAYLTARIPARMWRKGLSQENTTMSKLLYDGLHGQGNFNGPLVEAFIEKRGVFPNTLEEATGNVSCALSEFWAWSKVNDSIFLLGSPVGKVSMKKKTLMLLKEFGKFPLPSQLQSLKVVHV